MNPLMGEIFKSQLTKSGNNSISDLMPKGETPKPIENNNNIQTTNNPITSALTEDQFKKMLGNYYMNTNTNITANSTSSMK